MGLFLANYLWFYVAHSSPQVRRSFSNQVSILIDSYRSAFRIQFEGMRKAKPIVTYVDVSIEIEKTLQDIQRDALGFAGMYLLYLSVTNPDCNILALKEVLGNTWGDKVGRHRSLLRRMIWMSYQAFTLFSDDHLVVTSERIIQLMQMDDKLLLTG